MTLAIKSPTGNVCPGFAKLSVFFHANKKGKFSFLLVRNNGTVSGPYSKAFNLQTPVNARYRAVVTHFGKKASRWVRLKAAC